jgi:hypothetical protein
MSHLLRAVGRGQYGFAQCGRGWEVGGYVTFRNTNFELVGQQPMSHRVRPHEEREAKPASEL